MCHCLPVDGVTRCMTSRARFAHDTCAADTAWSRVHARTHARTHQFDFEKSHATNINEGPLGQLVGQHACGSTVLPLVGVIAGVPFIRKNTVFNLLFLGVGWTMAD